MARDVVDETPISSRDELVRWFEAGSKPQGPFLVGTEHEKIPFYRADLRPVPYEGRDPDRGGVKALLEGMRSAQNWEAIEDGGALIGLFDSHGGGAISLEPGGQFELSGAPLDSVHQTKAELEAHFDALAPLSEKLGLGFLDLGMSPVWTRGETPVMPKQRYDIMARYMPKVGGLGLDMMFRTSTVQTNIDFASEADMVAKMRLSVALQPMITALFANSPFSEGKPNGFLSMRSQIWTDTDPARTGMIPFVFEPDMGFTRYVDYALDVPLYFVKRGDHYHDVAGASFRDLLEGRLPQLPGEYATLSDWANHLSTLFPEVRLKRYIEMRGADVGPRSHIYALAALCAGLFYDVASQRRRLGPGQGFDRRRPPKFSGQRAARRFARQGRRTQSARSRPRSFAVGPRRSDPAPSSRRGGAGRRAISGRSGGNRRFGTKSRRAPVGAIPWRVARRHDAGFRGLPVLEPVKRSRRRFSLRILENLPGPISLDREMSRQRSAVAD